MKYFKKLVGERIYLSPRNAEDVEQFTEWMNDFEVTDYIGRTAQMISLSGEKEFLEKNANPESTFVIVDLKDKIKTSVPASGGGQAMLLSAMNTEIQEEAVAALTMLGFAAAPSQKVVLAILKDEPDAAVEKVIKLALKRL